jgi:hypothetical protein
VPGASGGTMAIPHKSYQRPGAVKESRCSRLVSGTSLLRFCKVHDVARPPSRRIGKRIPVSLLRKSITGRWPGRRPAGGDINTSGTTSCRAQPRREPTTVPSHHSSGQAPPPPPSARWRRTEPRHRRRTLWMPGHAGEILAGSGAPMRHVRVRSYGGARSSSSRPLSTDTMSAGGTSPSPHCASSHRRGPGSTGTAGETGGAVDGSPR